MIITIEIAKPNKNWNKHREINVSLIRTVVKNVISCFPNLIIVEKFELSVLLTDNKHMQDLNKQFRDKDYPTNVLSFPDIELDWKNLSRFTPPSHMYLGDVAFGYEVVETESTSEGKSFQHHFIHLLTHSILHLLGFDHESEEDAVAM